MGEVTIRPKGNKPKTSGSNQPKEKSGTTAATAPKGRTEPQIGNRAEGLKEAKGVKATDNIIPKNRPTTNVYRRKALQDKKKKEGAPQAKVSNSFRRGPPNTSKNKK